MLDRDTYVEKTSLPYDAKFFMRVLGPTRKFNSVFRRHSRIVVLI